MIQDILKVDPRTLPLYADKPHSFKTVIQVTEISHKPTIQLEKKVVQWKGKSIEIGDYDLFIQLINAWMKQNNWSKEQALDEFFDII